MDETAAQMRQAWKVQVRLMRKAAEDSGQESYAALAGLWESEKGFIAIPAWRIAEHRRGTEAADIMLALTKAMAVNMAQAVLSETEGSSERAIVVADVLLRKFAEELFSHLQIDEHGVLATIATNIKTGETHIVDTLKPVGRA